MGCGLGGLWRGCWGGDEGEVAMPEFGNTQRPPKKPLSHISEERSSQMHASSQGNTSRDRLRRSLSNSVSNADTYSTNGTRRTSTEVRHSNSFEESRQAAAKANLKSRTHHLEPYLDTQEEGSETSNLAPLPTQKQMNARRRSSAAVGVLDTIPDCETPKSQHSMCTVEHMTSRSYADEAEDHEYSIERMSEYLAAQLLASPPAARGKAPATTKVDTSSSNIDFLRPRQAGAEGVGETI